MLNTENALGDCESDRESNQFDKFMEIADEIGSILFVYDDPDLSEFFPKLVATIANKSNYDDDDLEEMFCMFAQIKLPDHLLVTVLHKLGMSLQEIPTAPYANYLAEWVSHRI
jgi:hypothetical protein